ncbi:hypothetical protein DFR86_07255 [Acidianus sulfidivorans JP7]|uniref:Uncharacterized protein n=1 Tax=Acidianus sulfidivorans JP7 TaxID=619593 RepID=A0A2U9IMY9_9CREN|nr:hypothetical protein [Acidianus sulfidivorans]AWR97365.1 hypothetical protein DFR86_07255 [Acidianus sulfidivorans JP7]
MKSVFGSIILQSAGVFSISNEKKKAEEDFKIASTIYPDFKISLLDLSSIDDRLKAIDIDPDLADLNNGFVVIIEVPDDIN